VESYVQAWATNSKKDITDLFTPQAEYHEWPYETDWIGRYKELGTFANLWSVTFDKSGKCTVFRMWNNEI
jgi:hypothetical protein